MWFSVWYCHYCSLAWMIDRWIMKVQDGTENGEKNYHMTTLSCVRSPYGRVNSRIYHQSKYSAYAFCHINLFWRCRYNDIRKCTANKSDAAKFYDVPSAKYVIWARKRVPGADDHRFSAINIKCGPILIIQTMVIIRLRQDPCVRRDRHLRLHTVANSWTDQTILTEIWFKSKLYLCSPTSRRLLRRIFEKRRLESRKKLFFHDFSRTDRRIDGIIAGDADPSRINEFETLLDKTKYW